MSKVIKLKGNKIYQAFNQKGESVVSVVIDKEWIRSSMNVNNISYPVSIEIKKHHDTKTYQQVKLIWAILTEIDEAYNGYSTKESIEDVYCNMIVQAEIKIDDLIVKNSEKDGIINILKDAYRVIKTIERDERQSLLRCYRGLSQFDKSETNNFIEIMLNYAFETIGYETPDVRELKKMRG